MAPFDAAKDPETDSDHTISLVSPTPDRSPLSHLKLAEISLQHIENAYLFNRPFRSLCIACNNFVTHGLARNETRSPTPSPISREGVYPSAERPDAGMSVADDAGTPAALDTDTLSISETDASVTLDAPAPATSDAGTSVVSDESFETAQLYIPDPNPPPTSIPIPSSLRCPFCQDAQWCSLACAQSGLQWFQSNSQFRCMVLFQSS